MLKMRFLTEDFTLARQALTHWAHNETTLAERMVWFRISSNAVYPFDDAQGRLCFLRLSPAEEKDENELLGELDFLQYLHGAGYPALRPIPADNGRLLLSIAVPGGRWYASAFTGVPGQPLEAVPMTDDLATAYGAALGRLHALSMAYEPPMRRRTHMDVLAWTERTLLAYGAPPVLAQICRDTAQQLAALPQTRNTYGPIHYDFEPDNVFWDGETCHVIDFEDGMLHFYVIDVVQALDEISPAHHAAFMAGYRSACPEAEVQEATFPLMRRFRDLYSCAQLRHCLSEFPQPQPEWMPALADRLRRRLKTLEAGVAKPSRIAP